MNEEALSRLILKDTAFQELMQRRIHSVLLVASPYDAFMMEEDGRIEEQLYFEYVSLNLSSPPRVTQVADNEAAIEAVKTKAFDLVIMMPGVDMVSDTMEAAKELKTLQPELPIVVLTPFSREVSRRLENEDLSAIDYVFSWLGNVDLLLAIIKLLEDRLNADNDINQVGVQMILLVEDSVRFYSSVLPHVYKNLLKQSRDASTEALNAHEQMLRMRGRPKVMLARDYEEAMSLIEQFGSNILGVISDVSFHREGIKDSKAGLRFARKVKESRPHLPFIIESSEAENRQEAEAMGCIFLDKTSKKLPVDLTQAMNDSFGFGDFVITDPETGREVLRISSLKDLQYHLNDIPDESLLYHASKNDISRWLYSRALFPIANVVKEHRTTSVEDAPAARQLFFDLIVKYRKMKNRGVVAVFKKDRFDHYSNFARIGEGSLGGKGRGLAFIDQIIKKHPVCDNYPGGAVITIPRTVVLCTDIFDEFMATNNLYPVALSDLPDADILRYFLQARLPQRLIEDFFALMEVVDTPLAIRSSSLLEDSHYQPFAGVYSTYMVPRVADRYEMLRMLSDAIKGVYASVFYADSKAYMNATSNVIDQEKMAVIIQEVVGRDIPGLGYFPSFAGVGRSLNYYPVGLEKAEEGVAEIAVGLGKYIVDGGLSLRFSPAHPAAVLQTSELELALRDTQTSLLALDTSDQPIDFSTDDGFNLKRVTVRAAAEAGVLKMMVSSFDHENYRLLDYDTGRGRRVVTFNNILKHDAFPLASAIDFMLTNGAAEMGRPVEIEFACMLDDLSSEIKGRIYWLQIRPIVNKSNQVNEALMTLPDSSLLLKSSTALGNGTMTDIATVVYVRPENFNCSGNPALAREIEKLNRQLSEQGIGYILIGPGRWGSSDPSLGIPVKWPNISQARLIVETSLPGYRVEPSQGTHFFQNLTSMGVGYFTVDPNSSSGFCNFEMLNSMAATYESEALRVVEFPAPLTIGIDGRKSVGVVALPGLIPSSSD
ncbi:MAG: phosphoenolpyruvate synthase [Pseudoflavonifractor sp.]|nr:phosphoenolpyruvate synthase [Alloprevotella sp.]MCM1116902.1 phosphoenolpyruvate synthase [Pseudoflavonifractor sp.]